MTAARPSNAQSGEPAPPSGYRLGEIVRRFGGQLIGDPEYRVHQVATLRSAGPEQISFCHDARYADELRTTRAGAVVVTSAHSEHGTAHRIVADDPYLYFARLAVLFNPLPSIATGVHASAVVAADAQIDPTASIGAHCAIAAGVRIGARVRIGAGSIVGEEVTVDEDTRIDANVTIYARSRIGRRCVLLAGAIVGADGFGHAREGGRWLKIPQIGAVSIGDDVEIGANTTIDRGALDDTVIEDGVKLDNQIQIGHNCRIGAHTVIAGCAGIAGSTRIGRNCIIGGSAMFSGHIEIADGVTVSGGTAIVKSITQPGTYTAVFPYSAHEEWVRNAPLLRHLREMMDRIRVLEQQVKKPEGK